MTDNSFADRNDKRGAATMKRSFERFTSFLMAFLMALNILMPTSAFAALSTDYQLGSSGGFYKVAIEFDGAAPNNLRGYRAFIRVKDQWNNQRIVLDMGDDAEGNLMTTTLPAHAQLQRFIPKLQVGDYIRVELVKLVQPTDEQLAADPSRKPAKIYKVQKDPDRAQIYE